LPTADEILIAEIRTASGRVEQHAMDLLKMVQLLNLFLAGVPAKALPPPAANDKPAGRTRIDDSHPGRRLSCRRLSMARVAGPPRRER